MQSKFEEFNKLLPELKIETVQNLSNRELANLAQTSKYHLALFKPVINVRKLLHHVTRGKHDSVQAMLNQDMRLIFKRGVVTDCSGRKFENISGFEYALWALDKDMWTAMIACIPQNEENRKVFSELILQYKKLKNIGATYKLNKTTITEQHSDFKLTVIKEPKTPVDLTSVPANWTINWLNADKHWRIGGTQELRTKTEVDVCCAFQASLRQARIKNFIDLESTLEEIILFNCFRVD